MARTDTLPHFLTDVADAIREKTGSSDTIQASSFDTAIEDIPSGGGVDITEYIDGNISNGTTSESGYIKLIKKLPPINISSGQASLQYSFYRCQATEIVLTGTPTKLTNISSAFQNCSNLEHLDIRTLDFSKVTSFSNAFGVPNNCEIIVKDSTAKTWVQTNFTNLTNVKTVAEYEQE